MRKRTWLVVALLVGILVVVLGTTSVFAQEPSVPGGYRSPDMAAHCQNMMGDWNMGGYSTGLFDPVTLKRVAGILGLTYEQLTARLAQGETIAQVAQAQKVDHSLVVAAILAPQNEILQVRVKYGYLTEAQAQAILEQARYWIEQTITTPQYGYYSPTGGNNRQYAPIYGGRGWGGGPGGMMGGGMMGGGMMDSGGMMGGGMMGGGMMGGGMMGGGMMGGGMMGGW